MQAQKKASPVVVGLALFCMFFGSGNLIFPLFMGQISQESWSMAAVGFLLTAVLMPIMGVIAMLLYDGDYNKFFDTLGRRGGLLLSAILLTVWIPLGSGARCISLSYASMATYLPMPVEPIFSLVYSFFVWLIAKHRYRILDILGYFLTPLLLGCLALIVFIGVFFVEMKPSEYEHSSLLMRGLVEGYNTMDLIASFFFSASIILILKNNEKDGSKILKTLFQGSFVAMAVLATVYVGLIYIAAGHSELLVGIPKEQLLAHLSKLVLGPQFGAISALTILLACFTTSVALVNTYAEFLEKNLLKGNKQLSLFLTLLACFVMSIFGLSGITAITSPVLQICYPLLVGLIIYNCVPQLITMWRRKEVVKQDI